MHYGSHLRAFQHCYFEVAGVNESLVCDFVSWGGGDGDVRCFIRCSTSNRSESSSRPLELETVLTEI